MKEAETRHPVDVMADRAVVGETPGQVTRAVEWIMWLVGPLFRLLFRPSLSGWEHLPEDRPFLVVSNHSGVGIVECACLLGLWQERFGNTRPIAGMAAAPLFCVPGAAAMARSIGAVPSTYRHAEAAFAAGASVIVFPGGDHEAFRPVWQASRVDFNGRKGYLRLARKVGAPIVPLGIRGSHYVVPILWRSQLLPKLLLFPRLIQVKRWPITFLAVIGAALLLYFLGPLWGYGWAGAAAFAWFVSPLTILPIIPWTISARLGPPLEPEALFGEGDEEQVLQAAHERVVGEIQRLVLERDPSG